MKCLQRYAKQKLRRKAQSPRVGPIQRAPPLPEASTSLSESPISLARPPIESLRRHNQMLAIAHLPHDLLLEIFMHCLHSPSYQLMAAPYHWLSLTHVCHYWREVALAHPKLWSTITLTPSASSRITHLIDLFLIRSSAAPLGLRCDLRTNSIHLRNILKQNRSRIQHLDLRAPQWLLSKIITQELDECSLTTLSIVNYTRCNQNEGGFWVPNTPFLAPIFVRRTALRLTSLSLESCAFDWDSPIYSANLTSLELSNINPIQRPSAARLFSILAGMPALVNLALVNAVSSDIEILRDGFIHLPKLSSIRLEGDGLICPAILSSILLPSSAQISVSCDVPTQSLWVVEVTALCCSEKPIYTTASVINKRHGVAFQLESEVGRLVTMELSGFRHSSATRVSRIMLTAIWRFPLENITLLELQDRNSDSPFWTTSELLKHRKPWQELSSLKQLCVLKLSGRSPLLLMETLFEHAMLCIGISMFPSTRHIGPDGVSRQLIAKLALIHLVDFNCSASALKGEKDEETGFLDLLTAFLWAVNCHRSQIPTIRMERCEGVCQSQVVQLRQFTEVAWDGSQDQIGTGAIRNYFFRSMNTFSRLASLYQEGEVAADGLKS